MQKSPKKKISLKHLLPFSPYRILIKVTSAPVCLALRELTVNTVCSPAQTRRAFMAADATRRITGVAMRVTVPEATLVSTAKEEWTNARLCRVPMVRKSFLFSYVKFLQCVLDLEIQMCVCVCMHMYL